MSDSIPNIQFPQFPHPALEGFKPEDFMPPSSKEIFARWDESNKQLKRIADTLTNSVCVTFYPTKKKMIPKSKRKKV